MILCTYDSETLNETLIEIVERQRYSYQEKINHAFTFRKRKSLAYHLGLLVSFSGVSTQTEKIGKDSNI